MSAELPGQLLLFVETLPAVVARPAPPPAADIARMFDAWYAHYPRHRAVAAAQKAFTRIITRGEATLADLIQGADRYGEECRDRGTAPCFISHPATWLNSARWLDEPDRAPISPATASAARVGDRWRQGQHLR